MSPAWNKPSFYYLGSILSIEIFNLPSINERKDLLVYSSDP